MIGHKFSGKVDNTGDKNHYIYFHQPLKNLVGRVVKLKIK